MLEGNVEVHSRDGAGPPADRGGGSAASVELSAGDRAVADAVSIVRRMVKDPKHAVAWRERRLVFEDDPLGEVAAEFNRYNSQRIVIEDEALAARRISGVFDADRPEAVVRFLVRNDDAEVIEQPGRHWVLRSKP